MIKKITLPNGIRIVAEHMPEIYSATMMVWIDAGTNVELSGQNGISHFIEHMVFKGTKHRSSKEIVQTIENYGGTINAFTDKEITCYYAKVLSNQVTKTIDILLDMVFNSTYDEKDLEIERQVIAEEIKMYEDTPDELIHDLSIKSLWGDHPLGQPVTGTLESIMEIKKEDILNFTENHYTPDNIVISIVGNFDEEAFLAQVNNSTGHISTVAKEKQNSIPVFTPQINVYDKEIEQSHICLGTRGISILSDDRYTLAIIDVCLGGCMASRLFQEIREKRGLVYSINTYEALYRPSGMFGVYSGTNPTNVKEVIGLIMHETGKLKSEGLSTEEFEKAKSQLKGSLLLGLESTRYRASRNGRSELYFNKIFSTEEICESIDKVTHADIKKLSNFIFDEKYMGISIISPKKHSPKELSLSC